MVIPANVSCWLWAIFHGKDHFLSKTSLCFPSCCLPQFFTLLTRARVNEIMVMDDGCIYRQQGLWFIIVFLSMGRKAFPNAAMAMTGKRKGKISYSNKWKTIFFSCIIHCCFCRTIKLLYQKYTFFFRGTVSLLPYLSLWYYTTFMYSTLPS